MGTESTSSIIAQYHPLLSLATKKKEKTNGGARIRIMAVHENNARSCLYSVCGVSPQQRYNNVISCKVPMSVVE